MDFVANIIDHSNRTWKRDLVMRTFVAEDVKCILCIPLARTPHEDV